MSVRHVGSLLIGLTVALFAANAEVRACTTDAECDDGNVCISDHCDPATGACSYQNNGSCTVNPKTVGYWTRVCRGTGSLEDAITDPDVTFMRTNSSCLAMVIHSVADVCRILEENRNDICWKGLQEFITLNLNLSHHRLTTDQGIDSHCSSHTLVVQSYLEADAILCADQAAPNAQCDLASCECKEINQGRALHVHGLTATRLTGEIIRLQWIAPMAESDDLTAKPRRYRVWRATDPFGPFVQIGDVADPTFDDVSAVGERLVYDVTPVW